MNTLDYFNHVDDVLIGCCNDCDACALGASKSSCIRITMEIAFMNRSAFNED